MDKYHKTGGHLIVILSILVDIFGREMPHNLASSTLTSAIQIIFWLPSGLMHSLVY